MKSILLHITYTQSVKRKNYKHLIKKQAREKNRFYNFLEQSIYSSWDDNNK